MVTCTGHIGIHEGADGRTDVRTDVDDVMAIKPNFLTSMGYHIFLTMVLHARAPSILQQKQSVVTGKFQSHRVPKKYVRPVERESPYRKRNGLGAGFIVTIAQNGITSEYYIHTLHIRHFKIEVSRQPQTSKCHVTSRLPSGLPFAVHVSTSGDLSCGK